jgi:tetratricopeptide (TPR) repeat protein/GNAT superfamily N-acetyltransferase
MMMRACKWKLKIGLPFVLMVMIMLISFAPAATAKHVSRLGTTFVTSALSLNNEQRRTSNRAVNTNGDERMGMSSTTTTSSPSLINPLPPDFGTMKDHDRIHNVMSVVRAQHANDVSLSLQTKLLPEQQPQQHSDIDIDGSADTDGSRRTETTEAAQHGDVKPGGLRYEWRNREASILETLDVVLDEPARHTILEAAKDYWSQQEAAASDDTSTTSTSRFTLQSANKREVHASDLNAPACGAINQALTECIFPLLRDAFAGDIRGVSYENDDDSMLLLYDALIIEYDATSLECSNIRERPSQPLHRDLGVISVNIALDDPAQFEGGGTVFEKLLVSQPSSSDNDDDISTILPRAAGHAVAHPSRERHAGGALISGRRTILVMFVTATHRRSSSSSSSSQEDGMMMPHPLEAAARCKKLGMQLSHPDSQVEVPDSSVPPLQGKQDQIMCYRTAVRYDPSDGEAWLYLAMALQSASCSKDVDGTKQLDEAIECLKTARQLNPNDGRVHNTLGIALQKRERLRINSIPPEMEDRPLLLPDKIMKSFRTAAKLHSQAAAAGCQGAAVEARSALLNWGLYHANLDEFEKAVSILRQVCLEGHVADTSLDDDTASQQQKPLDVREFEAKRIVRDAKSLLSFCEKQHAADASNTESQSATSIRDNDSSSFTVRLASEDRDNVHVEAVKDMINAAYKVGEKSIIVESIEDPFHRVTVDDVQQLMRYRKLLILTTSATAKEKQEKVLGCVKVEAVQVHDPDDPLSGQKCCEWGCLAVAVAEQQQGHGRRLVQAAEDYARNELGCTWLQLELLSPAHERHAHKDMLREWYTTRLGYQLKWVNDHEKSSTRYPKGELLLGVVRLVTDADFTTYRKQL